MFRESKSWAIRWVESGKRRYKAGFTTREDAQKVLDKVRGDIAMQKAGMPPDQSGVPPLSTFATPFLDARKMTHRAGVEDAGRWKKHLAPWFGHLRPAEVDAALIKAFIEAKRAEGLNPATIHIFVSLLSSLLTDLVERNLCPSNPARSLPRATLRLMKPTHDPRTTPFIEKLSDVRSIFARLAEPLNIAYAIGALAGLRTGEVFALKWEHVDLAARRIHVRESVKGPLKNKKSRVVPILDALAPILTDWKLRSGGTGLVVPPLRRDGKKIDTLTPGNYLRPVLRDLGLARDGLGWYEATRHTFASQWVMNGGSIEKLKEILGHFSVVMTERYAHLRTDLFPASDLGTIRLDLAAGEVVPVPVRQGLGARMRTVVAGASGGAIGPATRQTPVTAQQAN